MGGKFQDRGQKGREKEGLRVNREIRAPQIRVIDDLGQMRGVMTVAEGLRIAEDAGLDLIEVSPTAQPPTCKIMDYGKWKYENKKKQAQARKKQVIVQTKEIQMRPRTDQHDFETKMKHARRFLLEGDKVKISIRFLGRELSYQEIGMQLLKRCVDFVNDLVTIEVPAKMEGRNMFLLLAPDSIKVRDYLKANPSTNKHEEEEEVSESELLLEEEAE